MQLVDWAPASSPAAVVSPPLVFLELPELCALKAVYQVLYYEFLKAAPGQNRGFSVSQRLSYKLIVGNFFPGCHRLLCQRRLVELISQLFALNTSLFILALRFVH